MCLEEKKKEERRKFEQTIQKHIIKGYLFHIVDISNLRSIFSHGLLSRNEARNCGLQFEDISNKWVQNIRKRRKESIFKRSLHDYVSLYFNPRNPMLWVVKNKQKKDIVILGIDPYLLLKGNTIFTDGHAKNKPTKFYSGHENLEKLPWDIIYASNQQEFEDGWRIQFAEALIYKEVSALHIQKIFCCSEEQRLKARGEMPAGISIPVEINRDLYF